MFILKKENWKNQNINPVELNYSIWIVFMIYQDVSYLCILQDFKKAKSQ